MIFYKNKKIAKSVEVILNLLYKYVSIYNLIYLLSYFCNFVSIKTFSIQSFEVNIFIFKRSKFSIMLLHFHVYNIKFYSLRVKNLCFELLRYHLIFRVKLSHKKFREKKRTNDFDNNNMGIQNSESVAAEIRTSWFVTPTVPNESKHSVCACKCVCVCKSQ